MSKTMEKQIEELVSRVAEGEARFSRHLEVYANNGKELKELKEIIIEVVPMFRENTKQTKEMYNIFNGIATTSKWTSKIIKWIFGLLLGIGSLILMYNNVTK